MFYKWSSPGFTDESSPGFTNESSPCFTNGSSPGFTSLFQSSFYNMPAKSTLSNVGTMLPSHWSIDVPTCSNMFQHLGSLTPDWMRRVPTLFQNTSRMTRKFVKRSKIFDLFLPNAMSAGCRRASDGIREAQNQGRRNWGGGRRGRCPPCLLLGGAGGAKAPFKYKK